MTQFGHKETWIILFPGFIYVRVFLISTLKYLDMGTVQFHIMFMILHILVRITINQYCTHKTKSVSTIRSFSLFSKEKAQCYHLIYSLWNQSFIFDVVGLICHYSFKVLCLVLPGNSKLLISANSKDQSQ